MTICEVCDDRWDRRHDELEGCPWEEDLVWIDSKGNVTGTESIE